MWAYLSAVLDDISLVITWERWEGTIEHTLMAPVPRVAHLIGTAVFGVLHAMVRTTLIMVIALPFFTVDLGQARLGDSRGRGHRVGSFSLIGLGILAGVLPLLYPERGEQMSFMVQAVVLLVSGVYYSVETSAGVAAGAVRTCRRRRTSSRGIRAALIDGATSIGVGGRPRDPGRLRRRADPGVDRGVHRRRAVGQADRPPQAPGLTAMSTRMHDDQIDIDAGLVRTLLAEQAPHWAELPIEPVASTGTDNALFRLGGAMVVRVPLRPSASWQIERERSWLPFFAPHLPLEIPVPLFGGAPTGAYPVALVGVPLAGRRGRNNGAPRR